MPKAILRRCHLIFFDTTLCILGTLVKSSSMQWKLIVTGLKIGMKIWNRSFYVSSREICRESRDGTYHTRGFILAQINVCILWGYKSNLRFSSLGAQKLRQHKTVSWSLFSYSLKLSWRPPISKVSIDFGYPTWNSLKLECYKKEQQIEGGGPSISANRALSKWLKLLTLVCLDG